MLCIAPRAFDEADSLALRDSYTAQAADELGVIRREDEGVLEGHDGVIVFFLGDLEVGAEAEGVGGGRLSGVGAVEFG